MTTDIIMDDGVDPLVADAIDWIVRLTTGSPAEADFTAFSDWRMADDAHEQAFLAASVLCGDLRDLPLSAAQLAALADADNVVPFSARAAPPAVSRRAFLGGGAIAATLVGGVMLANPPLGLWPSFAEFTADERTRTGERRRFSPLAGVAVELNSKSSASRLDGSRGLKLIDGEAFVSVTRTQPFHVATDRVAISATDADFNLRAFGDQQCITCTRGALSVTAQGRTRMLKAGEEMSQAADQAPILARADAATRLAWRRGLLILRRTPLLDSIAQINRYFPGKLVLTDMTKSNWPVTGTFHIAQIDAAVAQISQLANMRIKRLPANVILLG